MVRTKYSGLVVDTGVRSGTTSSLACLKLSPTVCWAGVACTGAHRERMNSVMLAPKANMLSACSSQPPWMEVTSRCWIMLVHTFPIPALRGGALPWFAPAASTAFWMKM